MVSGSSRLVSGAMQLALLAFGILAGIQAVGVPSAKVLSDTDKLLGGWAPWLGVLVFAFGVTVAALGATAVVPRARRRAVHAVWCGQMLGNTFFGGYVSAFVGAVVMTPVADRVSQMPSAMPQYASFLPGYWLLVPGVRAHRPGRARRPLVGDGTARSAGDRGVVARRRNRRAHRHRAARLDGPGAPTLCAANGHDAAVATPAVLGVGAVVVGVALAACVFAIVSSSPRRASRRSTVPVAGMPNAVWNFFSASVSSVVHFPSTAPVQ